MKPLARSRPAERGHAQSVLQTAGRTGFGMRTWIAGLLLSLTTAAAGAADWYRAESPNFRLLARASRSMTQEKLQDLERLHQAMLLTLGVTQSLVRSPFPIVMSDDPEMIGRVVPHLRNRQLAGLFVPRADGSQAFVFNDRRANSEFTGKVIFHEYAHRVMAQYARISYPVWYVEGFAEYFGSTVIEDDAVVIGAGNQSAEILARRPWLDAARLLNPKFHSTGQQDIDDSNFQVFYAQSWLLTQYVLSKSDRTQRFNEYFRRVAAGEDPIATLEPATGISPLKLNSELRRHLDNTYSASIPNKALQAVTVRVTEVATEEAEAELDAMIIVTRPEAEHGKQVLQRLRERVKKAGGERAPDTMRWALAYGEIRYGEAEKALEILSPWAQMDAPPFEANRLLGWAWQTQAAHATGADRTQAHEQARAFLVAAYKQRRNDAPTLYQLAQVLSQKGLSPSLTNAADAANVLEPQVGEYAYLAIWVHLQDGNRDKARRGLESLANNPHGGESTERARAALQALQSNQEVSQVLALLNGSKKPTP
jgi:tetratricopeptide (TPR) repeat protein